MEDIAAPLEFVLFLRGQIENGVSIRKSIDIYTSIRDNKFSKQLDQWINIYDKLGTNHNLNSVLNLNRYRQSIVDTLQRGMEGHSINKVLEEIEKELIDVSCLDVEKRLHTLPFIVLVPLLIFQFPALLVLVFFPLIQEVLVQL